MHFQGKQLCHSHCCLNSGHFLKKRICSHRSKFFHLRVDPILGRFPSLEKQIGSHYNCLYLKTWRRKIEVYQYILNVLTNITYSFRSDMHKESWKYQALIHWLVLSYHLRFNKMLKCTKDFVFTTNDMAHSVHVAQPYQEQGDQK